LAGTPAEKKAGKLMYINNVLYIRHEDGIYSLDGRRVR